MIHFSSFFSSPPFPSSLVPFPYLSFHLRIFFIHVLFLSIPSFLLLFEDYFISSSFCPYSSPSILLPPLFHPLFPFFPSSSPNLPFKPPSLPISSTHFFFCTSTFSNARLFFLLFLLHHFLPLLRFFFSFSCLPLSFLILSTLCPSHSLFLPFLFLFHLPSPHLLLLFLFLLLPFHCGDSHKCAWSAWKSEAKRFALPSQHFNAAQKQPLFMLSFFRLLTGKNVLSLYK